MGRPLLLLSSISLGAIAGLLGWLALAPQPSPVLHLHGYEYAVTLPSDPGFTASIRAAVSLRSKQLSGRSMYLRVQEQIIEAPAEEFGLILDQDAAVAMAKTKLSQSSVGPRKNFNAWVWRRLNRVPQREDVSIPLHLEKQRLTALLTRIAAATDREAVDAELLISEHKILKSIQGRRLSLEASLIRFENTEYDADMLVDAVVETTEPRVTEEDLAPVDVTRVLASYETSFRGKAGARAVNIRTAGRYLDGAVLLPGEVLSFNDQVGRRIPGRGFVDAPVIVNDELELDVGGGVCQVATTLHAAAVFGNVEVVRRRSHSRPSGYAPLGLDATVIDGKVDLQLRNPYDEPLLVHVSFPGPYLIRVELLGRSPNVRVEHAYSVTEREPFARRIWHREEVPLGGVERKQKGSEGMDVVSVLRIHHADGKLDQRRYFSKYYPVPEVYWVGEGTSRAALPELPKGAAALVIDGEVVEGAVPAEEAEERPETDVPSLTEADSTDS